jgi:hypothetical protein
MKTTKLFFTTIALAFWGITSMNAQTNLITNGDFETFGTDGKPTGWSCTSSSTTYIASTDAHSGSSALSIVTTNANQRNLNQALPTPLTAGETYTLSFWYKCTSAPTSSTFKSEIQWVGDEGGITPYMSVTADISELNVWKQATVSAVVPVGVTSAKLYFFITSKPAIIIDDVVVTKGTAKQDQTITGLSDINKTYGDADFDLSASASSNLSVTYSSSNENVATISGSTVHIVGAGSTTITASQAGNDSYSAATDVTATLTIEELKVSAIRLGLSLLAGSTAKLTATVSPSNASNTAVNWSSDNTGIASVDANGNISALSVGTALITVASADGAKSVEFEVTVNTSTAAHAPVAKSSFSFSLQPNPVVNEAHFYFDEAGTGAQISISDLSGKTISVECVSSGSREAVINVSNLSGGIYVAKYADSTGESSIVKLKK